ncbi:MAG: putative membrane protein YdjX (TVP38/TMEM64 family) [Verrucomicrobiales bacterium]|jgi:uncharacterized membrane protein YdjX (TVP38/TMEM64 family)
MTPISMASTKAQSPDTAQPAFKRADWRKLAIILAAAAALVTIFTVFDVRSQIAGTLASAEKLGARGPVLFVLVYVVATVFFIPGSALTLGAGTLFGVSWGAVYVSIASTLSATAAFLVGRYLARGAISKKIEGNERFATIDKAVSEEGWKIVGLTRLSPVFPFALLNYAFGLTNVKLSHFVLASWIGMMPGTVMYVYLGAIAGAAGQEKTPAQWALYGVGLIATVVVTIFVTKVARRALAKRTGESV